MVIKVMEFAINNPQRRALCTLAPALLYAGVALAAQTGAQQPSEPGQETTNAKSPGQELFNRSVKPILLSRCSECHGGRKVSGDFDLSTREKLIDSGMIEPGDGKASWLVKLVRHEEEPHMPFKKERLPEAEIAKIVEWIDAGAPYDGPLSNGEKARPASSGPMVVTDEDRQAWSFRRLAQVVVPEVKNANWARTPIDRFVLARLEDKQIAPCGEASKRQLIRRAYFDLIGLPPAPDEVAQFAADESSDAFEKVVDRLLASPHFGERWARHWLDVVRYAESHGFEHDHDRDSAYHYRDFVIKSLNDDVPYERFVRWQLAGDELAPLDPSALAATGFLAAGVHNTQITANQVEKERYDELDDIVSTIGTAMLGLTVGCARCHDHKYDPIPTADYYRLVANFTTTVRSETELELNADRYRREKERFNERLAPIVAARDEYERKELSARFERWLADTASPPSIEPLATWAVLDPQQFSSEGYPKDAPPATLTKQSDGSIQAGGSSPLKTDYTIVATTTLRGLTAVRLEALADEALPRGGPGRAGNGNFALSDFGVTARPLQSKEAAKKVKVVDAKATFQQNDGNLSIRASIDDNKESGWAVDHGGIGRDQAAVFVFDEPIDSEGGVQLTFRLKFNNNSHHSLGRLRLSVTSAPGPSAVLGDDVPQRVAEGLRALSSRTPGAHTGPTRPLRDDLSENERDALRYWFRSADPQWRALDEKVREFSATAPRREIAKVLFCGEGVKPLRLATQGKDFFDTTYQLNRGDPNQKVCEAQPGYLQIATTSGARQETWRLGPPAGAKSSSRRASLARWITDVDQGAGHLLARVIVNRIWQHHLGRGIVATPSDFGLQGDPPSHPELLDWLAQELVRNGWRTKPLHKLIMTSAVYRQDSHFDDAKAKVDPSNELLWRFVPRRLEGEIIRDSMLAISGRLDPTMYGPGEHDDNHTRRSIYFFQKRSRLPRMISQFDGPDTLGGLPARATTTVAPQALLLLNNGEVDVWARGFFKRLSQSGLSPPKDAVGSAYQIALSRLPNDAESDAAVSFIKRQTRGYADESSNPSESAWTDFCKALLCLNELIYVD